MFGQSLVVQWPHEKGPCAVTQDSMNLGKKHKKRIADPAVALIEQSKSQVGYSYKAAMSRKWAG